MSSSEPADPNDPESHKNEGFLKSMWHSFTNHPAHQKTDGTTGEATSDANKKQDTQKDAPKQEEDPKKSAGSGSG